MTVVSCKDAVTETFLIEQSGKAIRKSEPDKISYKAKEGGGSWSPNIGTLQILHPP